MPALRAARQAALLRFRRRVSQRAYRAGLIAAPWSISFGAASIGRLVPLRSLEAQKVMYPEFARIMAAKRQVIWATTRRFMERFAREVGPAAGSPELEVTNGLCTLMRCAAYDPLIPSAAGVRSGLRAGRLRRRARKGGGGRCPAGDSSSGRPLQRLDTESEVQ